MSSDAACVCLPAAMPTVACVHTRAPNPGWPAYDTGKAMARSKPRTKQGVRPANAETPPAMVAAYAKP